MMPMVNNRQSHTFPDKPNAPVHQLRELLSRCEAEDRAAGLLARRTAALVGSVPGPARLPPASTGHLSSH